MKDATAGAGSDDPAFFLIASLSSHALSVDWNHVVSGNHWHRQVQYLYPPPVAICSKKAIASMHLELLCTRQSCTLTSLLLGVDVKALITGCC